MSRQEAVQLLAFSSLPIQQVRLHLRRAVALGALPAAQSMAAQRPAQPDRLLALPFIRDVAGGNLVGWIDGRLQMTTRTTSHNKVLPVG